MDVEELRGIELFTGLTDDQLAELATGGDEVPFEPGDVLFTEGEHADEWWVLLAGSLDLVRRVGREDVVVARMDVPGDGPAASARGMTTASTSPPDAASTPGRVLRLDAPRLRELVNHWFPLAGHLIGGLHHTARSIESTVRQRDALVTLGTLAAGLAHEINNPAAAASRTVDDLGQMLRRPPRGADPAGPRRHHRRPVQRARRPAAVDRRPRAAGRPGPGRPRERAGHLARPDTAYRTRGRSPRPWSRAGSTPRGASERTTPSATAP